MSKKGQWNRAIPLAFAIGIASTGFAQAQAVVGGKPEVQVDTSVLDQLGPPSNLPEMFLQQAPAETEKVTLVPPKSLRAAGHAAGKKSHHHLTVTQPAAPEATAAAIHLHPPGHHEGTRHHEGHAAEHKTSAKPVKDVAATTPPKDTGPATLTPTLPPAATAPAAATAPQTSAAAVPPPVAVTQAPVTTPAPASSSAGGNIPVALTAQQPSSSDGANGGAAQENISTITFDKDSARLPDGARDSLAHLASRMTDDATLEVQLLAYAAGDEENASKARRLSLSRALAVRSFLIDQGVRSTRIEVRALGNKVPEGSPDRVDIVGQKRG